MKPYPSYKDSGIEWIGDIPEHWEVKKLKFFVKICNGKDVGLLEVKTGGYPVYGTGGVFKRSEKFIYDKTSVLLGRKGTIDKPQYVNQPFWTVDTVYYTEIYKITNPKYFYYLTKQIPFDLYTYGSAVPSMTKEHLDNILFPSPPLSEQTAIADFLDHKTAQIDQSIEKGEELIRLLKEHRAALIHEAVTRGLDDSAPMKDSGLTGIGKIPAHWGIITMKFIANLKSGDSIISADIKTNGQYPVYGGNGIRGYTDSYTHNGKFVLIGRQGALCGNIHYAVNKFWASEHAVVCKLKEAYCLKWFGELLRAMNLNQYSVSAAQPGLSVERIKNLKIPVPPLEEQRQIVEYIETETARIDAEIGAAEKEIRLLKEYRQALISEAVTGKIDVREVSLE